MIVVAGQDHHNGFDLDCDGVLATDFMGSCCDRLSVVDAFADALAIDLLDNPWLAMLSVESNMWLKVSVPLPLEDTDTRMKYIQNHYFHHRADDVTDLLSKGRQAI